MTLIFLNCEKSLNAEDFNNIEHKLQKKIPTSIKNHYLNFNGGYPNKSLFTDEDEVLEIEIMDFIPFLYAKEFGNDPVFTIEGRTSICWKKNEIPSYLLPFAMDWGGNYIAYNLQNNQIYYYVTDSWSEEINIEENFIKNSQLIANNFKDFLQNLQHNPFDDRIN